MIPENMHDRPSGKIGFIGPIYMTILGIVGSLFFGAISGLIYVRFMPLLRNRDAGWLTFFMPVISGVVVGSLVGIGGKLCKVRNSKVILLFGFVSGVVATYASWVSSVFFKKADLILFPLAMMKCYYDIGSNDWKGFVIPVVIWGIEAIIIISGSMLMATVTTDMEK